MRQERDYIDGCSNMFNAQLQYVLCSLTVKAACVRVVCIALAIRCGPLTSRVRDGDCSCSRITASPAESTTQHLSVRYLCPVWILLIIHSTHVCTNYQLWKNQFWVVLIYTVSKSVFLFYNNSAKDIKLLTTERVHQPENKSCTNSCWAPY